jgi:hypothetical protein
MTTSPTPYQVGDAVHLYWRGATTPGRISAMHRRDPHWTYAIRTTGGAGAHGDQVNSITTSPDGNWISAINWPGSARTQRSRGRAGIAR